MTSKDEYTRRAGPTSWAALLKHFLRDRDHARWGCGGKAMTSAPARVPFLPVRAVSVVCLVAAFVTVGLRVPACLVPLARLPKPPRLPIAPIL